MGRGLTLIYADDSYLSAFFGAHRRPFLDFSANPDSRQIKYVGWERAPLWEAGAVARHPFRSIQDPTGVKGESVGWPGFEGGGGVRLALPVGFSRMAASTLCGRILERAP
jgi:hypothetical protein